MRVPKPWFRESNQTWYVQINKQQVSLGKSKQKAFARYDQLMKERANGRVANNCKLHEIIRAYWQWFRANRAASTIKARKGVLESFQEFIPKHLKARDLRPFHVLGWLESTRAQSPNTINDRIAFFSGMMNWAKRHGYIDFDNPLADMDKQQAKIRQEFVPPERFAELLGHCLNQQIHDFITMMLTTGARTQEMFDFTAAHFDGKKLTLPIDESKGRQVSRVVYLPAPALAIVRRLVAAYPAGALFRNTQGVPWTKDSINCQFRRLKRKMKMPSLCATTLRHSFAHHRLTMGQDSLTVSKLLGHADGRMLARRYGHLEGSEFLENAANGIGLPVDSFPNLSGGFSLPVQA